MNFRSYHLGGGAMFYTTWSMFMAACDEVAKNKNLGLLSLKADTERVAIEGQACALINLDVVGRA